ncbi:hypothetical protein OG884_15510 [Streptosporangium sp. NBC_01755]|uniref:hypothetical protein n=1 Tax=Streptosporangium sp. NBC_01755 TaxID=2975949 RepID=UPI002DD9B946|nr:hypothetical protein [Streptosporangium sp. NBC_01755]WSD03241.1 hypothetical protein OG884_15510 [Streptosporangium sp. NBC_01755]
MLYLTVEIRTKPEHMTSPPYMALLSWCTAESIPLSTGRVLEVFDEVPVRRVLHVITLDENDEWVLDPETGEPVTTPDEATVSSLPPLQGYLARGGG